MDSQPLTVSQIAAVMVESTMKGLRCVLYQEGLEQARVKWDVLNGMYSDNDWWAPVARAKRTLFDTFLAEHDAEERRREEARLAAQSKGSGGAIFISGNIMGAKQQQWSADQIVGLAEGDVVRTKHS